MKVFTPQQLKEHNKLLKQQLLQKEKEEEEARLEQARLIEEHKQLIDDGIAQIPSIVGELEQLKGISKKVEDVKLDIEKSNTQTIESIKGVNNNLKDKSDKGHTHIIGEVTGLSGKFDEFNDKLTQLRTTTSNALESKLDNGYKPLLEDIVGLPVVLDSLRNRIIDMKVPEVDLSPYCLTSEVDKLFENYWDKDHTYNRDEINARIRGHKTSGGYNYINDSITDDFFTWSSTKIESEIAAAVIPPGGSDTYVQYNDGGAFGGDAGFTYNKTTDTATIGQIIDSGLTASRAVVSDGSKQLTSSATTATEIGYVSGVTSGIQAQLNTKENLLTFSTGLTRTVDTITVDLSTGKAGGLTAIGGTAAGESLTLSSTTHATKGTIVMGTSIYDEVNNRLGIRRTPGTSTIDIQGESNSTSTGSEQIINIADQDFSSSTGNRTGTNWTIGSGVATHTAGANTFILDNAALVAAPVSGLTYKVIFTVTTTVAGTLTVAIGGATSISYGKVTGTVTQTAYLTASATTSMRFTPSSAWTGTIDDVSVSIITVHVPLITGRSANGTVRLEIRSCGSNDNTAIGQYALQICSSTGSNTAVGMGALQRVTSGNSNVAVGKNALGWINTNDGVAIGSGAMASATNASNCVAIGKNVMLVNEGVDNTGIGGTVLTVNTTGMENVAIGKGTMISNTTGSQNMALGKSALSSVTTGSSNVAVGYNCGLSLTTGSNNLYIGASVTTPSASASGQLVIQNIIFGTGNTTTGTTVGAGSVAVGTNTPDRRFHVEMAGSGTNAVEYAERLTNTTSGTATTGYGVGVEYELENASGTNRVAATQEFAFTDATNATEDASYALKLIKAGTLANAVRVSSLGYMIVGDGTGGGHFGSLGAPALCLDTATTGFYLDTNRLFISIGGVFAGGYTSTQRYAPTGTAATPSVCFNGDGNTGLYGGGADTVGLTTAGVARLHIDSAGATGIGTISPDRLFHVESSDAVTNAVTYAQRISHISSGTVAASFGTGVEYELENASGTNRVAATQEFTWSDATDATEDTTYTLKLMRAGTLTEGFSVSSAGTGTLTNLSVATALTIGASGYISWSGRSVLGSPADGIIRLSNDAVSDFSRLQFGGTTSSFPSLKRSTTGLIVRLADDSADTDVTAAKVISTNIVRLKGYTVATLPAGTQGDTAFCTDLTAPTYLAVAVGGGAVVGTVFYDGTNRVT